MKFLPLSNAHKVRRLLFGYALLFPLAVNAEDKAPVEAPGAATVTRELAPVIVNGRRNPLDEADRRLDALKRSLPGTDAPRKRDFADWYQAHDDPNTLSPERQALMLHLQGRNADDVKREAP